ncbi:hypothetical protein [Sphingopyxis sp. GW247-27LB]|uniref:hypothetical protein n=1 Tax=Sphingopyxis sp. GW247-27LB TaxID=2012632 RepID=UPI000BA7563A|nr:hypothetical protein [Sphingopyxis sp. GW247-27LB]PAL23588.1 hypothetical protein CD928_05840 [Sphingopyxis sp. GW247-27LB]
MEDATARITRIHVTRIYESCERITFFVQVTTDEGFEMTVVSHATGSIYTDGKGLTVDEARDRALTDAADWGDFLRIAPDPFLVDGYIVDPKLRFERFTTRRVLAERRAQKQTNV